MSSLLAQLQTELAKYHEYLILCIFLSPFRLMSGLLEGELESIMDEKVEGAVGVQELQMWTLVSRRLLKCWSTFLCYRKGVESTRDYLHR